MKLDKDIVLIVPGKSRVHETGILELKIALRSAGIENSKIDGNFEYGKQGILLGVLDDFEIKRELIREGKTNLHDLSPREEAFEIFMYREMLCLLGSNPRGMLHAVYQLHEILMEDGEIPSDIHIRKSFQICYRIFHQRFNRWPGRRADIRYLSRLGASHCLLEHDWQGNLRHFQGYVTSPFFPRAVDREDVERNNPQLHELIENCKDYGLETCFWMTELPCQGGPWVPEASRRKFLERFPREVLSESGTYQGKVLCFSHPRVREFYRDLIRRFLGEFPEISILFLFGLDADGEFCDPGSCPRCGGMTKFAQRDRLINFLIEEGRKIRPGLRVLTTGWGWELRNVEEFLDRQKKLPAESGLYMPAEYDGWQVERQDHHLLRETREICRGRGQLFIGYDNFHWGDDTVHQLRDIQDFPLGIGAKIKRWRDLEVDGVFDHWGGINEDISSNSIACREFFLNPSAEVKETCRKIALRQFGEKAGEVVFDSWCELEKAHEILSDHCHWSPGQWPGWYSGLDDAPVPQAFECQRAALLNTRQPEKFKGSFNYNPRDFTILLQGVGDAWQAARPHYEKAIELMNHALPLATDDPVGYAFWWNGHEKSPSSREHIQRQIVYLNSMAHFGREIGIHFGLHALYEKVGRNADAYSKQATILLAEDLAACRAAGEYFRQLETEGKFIHPSFALSGKFLGKAEKIREYCIFPKA